MPVTRNNAVTTKYFSGQAKVHSADADALAAIIRDGLIADAKDRAQAVGDAALTDSSTGVAGAVFTSTNADDTITLAATIADEAFATGDGPFQVVTSAADLPSGLVIATDYWFRRISNNVYTLHTTKVGALTNTALQALADDGSGAHRVSALVRTDSPVAADLTGLTTGFTIASADTSFELVEDAYATLATRVNKVLRTIGAGTLDVGAGADGAGTIAAMDADVAVNAGGDADATTFASANTILQELYNGQETLSEAISIAKRAVGLGGVPRARHLQGTADLAVGINGGDAITGAVETVTATIVAAMTEAAVELVLQQLEDNVAFLAIELDLVSAVGGTALVVDTNAAFSADLDVAESYFVTAPISGRITGYSARVGDAPTGTTTVTIELEGSAVTGASLAIAGAIGDLIRDAVSGVIAPDTANTNYVTKGDSIELVSDGIATGNGTALITVEITGADENAVVLAAYAG